MPGNEERPILIINIIPLVLKKIMQPLIEQNRSARAFSRIRSRAISM